MKWLTLPMIKSHSRIEYDCEDSNLERWGAAAEVLILNICSRTEAELKEMGGGEIPPTIVEASLLLTDHFYTNRSGTSSFTLSVVPYGIDVLVKPYMKLTQEEE
jgi:hypothetical protein